LKKIWLKEYNDGYIFGPENTLVIDFDTLKVRDCMENTFIIEPYTKELIAKEVDD
jgi:hypothetical protein